MGAKLSNSPSQERVLIIRGVPPHLWREEIFMKLMKLAGRFEEFLEDRETKRYRTCKRVRILNLVDRIPHTTVLRWQNLCFSVGLNVEYSPEVWKQPASRGSTRGESNISRRREFNGTAGAYGACSVRRKDARQKEGVHREVEVSQWSDHRTMEERRNGLEVDEEGRDKQSRRERNNHNFFNRNDGDRTSRHLIEEGEVDGCGPKTISWAGQFGPLIEGTDERLMEQTNSFGPQELGTRPVITYQRKLRGRKNRAIQTLWPSAEWAGKNQKRVQRREKFKEKGDYQTSGTEGRNARQKEVVVIENSCEGNQRTSNHTGEEMENVWRKCKEKKGKANSNKRRGKKISKKKKPRPMRDVVGRNDDEVSSYEGDCGEMEEEGVIGQIRQNGKNEEKNKELEGEEEDTPNRGRLQSVVVFDENESRTQDRNNFVSEHEVTQNRCSDPTSSSPTTEREQIAIYLVEDSQGTHSSRRWADVVEEENSDSWVPETLEADMGIGQRIGEEIDSQLMELAELVGISWDGRRTDAEVLFKKIIDRWDAYMENEGDENDINIHG